MAQNAQKDLLAHGAHGSVADTIDERFSQELIFALVGPVGSGVSTTATYLNELLTLDFGYAVAPIIKMSDIIRDEAHRVGVTAPPRKPIGQYIDVMQTAGNKLREKLGNNYLTEKAIEKIVTFRTASGGYAGSGIPLPGRRAYIIDSLKNIDEFLLLRQIYGDTLCLVGVFAPDLMRTQRLKDDSAIEAKDADLQKIMARDHGEIATFGQMTRRTFVESDFFVCNDRKRDELRAQLSRYLQLIFDTAIHTPTTAESAMYKADSVASNSACMSRQVGAAIVSATGELISVGCNDVPKFGGGLYTEDDQNSWDDKEKKLLDKDNRCFKWGGNICHNELRRNTILTNIAKKIAGSDLVKRGANYTDIRALLAGTEVDSLTEFSRSIHAEMEAILAVAREGRHSLVGATLYTSTYPCHSCARHIVASGIKSVIYIQPYAKSLATVLHSDSVTEDLADRTRVVFRQYEGVAPRNFLKLFRPTAPRKKDGYFSRVGAKIATPIFRIPLDSPVDYEAKVIAELERKEQDSESASGARG